MASYASKQQYLGESPLAYLIAASHPWAVAQAKKEGKVFKNGVTFESGVDETTAEDFFKRLGTHSPTGSPIPNAIRPGVNLGGEYRVTDGSGGRSDWPNYDPSDGTTKYRKIANVPGGMIWKRESQAPAAAPAPTTQTPPPQLDTGKIREAQDRAAIAKQTYETSIPGLNTSFDPYASAADFGRRTQDSLLKYQDFRNAQAGAQATEIGEASKNALARFAGKVEDYKLPNWRDYLNA